MLIYKVTNSVNGKVYIGQTTCLLRTRKANHRVNAFTYNQPYTFQRALRKYGWDAWKWEIIDTATTQEELNEKEIYWIDYYKSCIYSDDCHGYNSTSGGGGRSGYELSEETKKKIGDAQRGKPKHSAEVRMVISKKATGRPCPEHVKQIVSNLHKGKTFKHSDETKRKMSEAKKGRPLTAEWKAKVGSKGEKNPKAKLTEVMAIEIKSLLGNKNNNGLTNNVIAGMFGVSKSSVDRIAQGKTWKHVV